MSQILTQEEVDALLKGISDGEVETEPEKEHDPSVVLRYDLTSQDRIIRGRMPALEMTNEKFARMFRGTLSSLLRKVVNISALSIDTIKYGDFLKTLPVPTSLHLFRIDPLRGNAIIVVESKVIFTLVDIVFGGSGRDGFKVEGREFTPIENNLIKKVVVSALLDLEKAWKALLDVKMTYQRSEVNPQFAQIVPLTDVVIVVNFEVEMEYSSGIISLCVPYSTLEPIREKLMEGFQGDHPEIDRAWEKSMKDELMNAGLELVVLLGRTHLLTRDVRDLKIGDVILLDQYASEPIDIYMEGMLKFRGYPGVCRGNQAVQIKHLISRKEVIQYGTE
ncbi:MAG: flagellar motor switch protein FliM [Deltaproteobacteria bacterium]|nr:flagellar motor switch protein FliM [Deltaproteobacteria bacterium]